MFTRHLLVRLEWNVCVCIHDLNRQQRTLCEKTRELNADVENEEQFYFTPLVIKTLSRVI